MSSIDIKPQKNDLSSYNYSSIIKPSNDLIGDSPYAELVLQCEAEYQASKKVLDPKVAIWQRRLKIYNNQKRADDAVGDPLLFTVMQTVIASLYDDKLIVEFTGRNEGDEDTAGNLNNLAEYDNTLMQKDELDYNWLWDTGFFGRSILYMTNFDKKKKCPTPDLQNPMLFFRDPKAVSINGDINGRNSCRFFGRMIEMTRQQMKDHPEYFDVDMLRTSNSMNSEISTNRQAYDEAQGLSSSQINEQDYRENAMYELLEWCTHWKGKKCLVVLGNDRTKVVRYHEFKDEGERALETWPVIDRPMYPTSHNWDGTSIPDIIEDKQRMRAIMMNLAVKHQQADLYPMYIYNLKRVKNKADLNFDFNKFVPIEGEGSLSDAVHPLQKAQFNSAVHQYIMDSLSTSAESATATPQMQQGSVEDQRRTATEIGMVDRNVGTRYSLTAKVFGWSEKRFWQQWYRLYKHHYADKIYEKVIRLEGAFGAKFRPLTRENIVMKEDPDVKISSKLVLRAERIQKKQDFAQYLGLVAQSGGNMRYGLKKLGTLMELPKDELERLIPPTIDERIAEEENASLSKNEPIRVNANDNHEVHLEIHAKAADTDATYAHTAAHEHALKLMRDNPSLFPQAQQAQQQQQAQAGGQQPNPGQDMARMLNSTVGGKMPN